MPQNPLSARSTGTRRPTLFARQLKEILQVWSTTPSGPARETLSERVMVMWLQYRYFRRVVAHALADDDAAQIRARDALRILFASRDSGDIGPDVDDAMETITELLDQVNLRTLDIGGDADEAAAAASAANAAEERRSLSADVDDAHVPATSSEQKMSQGDRQKLVRSIVEKTTRSRQARSVVAPSLEAWGDMLIFRTKGHTVCKQYSGVYENRNEQLELIVMNTAGHPQPAASFLEFIRMVFVEILALRDAFVDHPDLEYCEDDDEGFLWHEDVSAEGEGAIEVMSLLLEPPLGTPGVPWPLMELLHGSCAPACLRRLVAQNRLELTLLRLVLSRTILAGVTHLFDDFFPTYHLLPDVESLQVFMSELLRKAHLYSNNFHEFEATCYPDGTAMGKLYQADHNRDGERQTIRWHCGRWSSGPVDLSGSEEDDSDGEAFESDSDGDYNSGTDGPAPDD